MKKITVVVMCVLLLVGVMSFNAFALNFYSEAEPATSPVIDGKINSGEYVFTTSPLDKKVAVENQFYVTAQHIDGQTLTVEYLFSYDNDSIYFAIAERTLGFTTSDIIDLVFCTRDGIVTGKMNIAMEFVRDNEKQEAYEPVFKSFVLDGKDLIENISDYITDAKGFYSDDGIRNNNYVEIKLNRSEVENFVGEEVAGFGLRVVNQPNGENHGETVFGDENSIVYPDGLNTNIGYHFFGFSAGVLENLKLESDDTAPIETEPDETAPKDTQKTESENVSENNETDNAEPEKKGGCSSSVSLFGLSLITCIASCIVITKKRR